MSTSPQSPNEPSVRPGASRLRRLFGLSGKSGKQKLGTFLGVYTPTVLTILGVIMYLRFGWVVGQVGLGQTLLIVVMANSITLATALSFSAVATNTQVGVGGAYFIISRSLGLEIGGAIGLPLFLSQAFSVTLYAFGLAESLAFVLPGVPVQPVAFIIIILVAALAFRGAGIALASQIPVMALIAISLVALALGAFSHPQAARAAAATAGPSASFWAVFAVFFPAVTGIMAGLGLSGDLEAPDKSLPWGSLAASLTGFAIYLVVPVLLTIGASDATLRSDPLVWTRIAPLGPWLILPGLWGAIFSSAVGSMLGAPRTLQALAIDRLAPRALAEAKHGREPLYGLVVTLAIALGAVLLGDLNHVAVVVTMFFLTVYGTVNLVAALETLSGDTSWRPKLKVPWPVSLLGAFGSFAVMFLISVPAGLVAIAIEIVLYALLTRRERRADWGDVRRGVYEALMRWTLMQLRERPMTARNWRPHVLVFTEHAERRLDLVRYGTWFSQDRGVVTVVELVEGDLEATDLDLLARRAHVTKLLEDSGIGAFGEVDVVRSVEEGIVSVTQANGIAGMQSNTVLLGWPNDKERLAAILRVTRQLELLRKSVVIGRPGPLRVLRQDQRLTVDVWWGGLQRNGDLMLLLAHLITRNREWRGARLRVLSIASSELAKTETERALARLLPGSRISAETKIVVKPKDASVHGLILQESAGSDAVFLGLAVPPAGEEASYAERLTELAEGLPSFFFVKNASLFEGELL